MPLIWNDSLLTGISTVDNQHKELFKRINEFLDSAGRNREKIPEISNFLQNYIVNHFGTEERLMLRTGYPDYTAHKNAHEKYSQDFKRLREGIEKEGINVKITVEMNHLLVDWWINHINNVDKKMAEFVRDKI